MKPLIRKFENHTPHIDKSAFVAENAVVIGNVTIGAESSLWYGCTARGDVNDIKIGKRTNIQDHTIIHVSSTTQGTYIGDDVTIGHGCIIHACTIGSQAFIGMQSCVMDDSLVESGAMLAAGSLLTSNKIVPSGELWGGRPAKYMRELTEEEKEFLTFSAERYVKLSRKYL